MAKLSTVKRNNVKNSDFALPEERKYPVNDAAHAKDAKARASQAEHKGRIDKATERKIDAKANSVIESPHK